MKKMIMIMRYFPALNTVPHYHHYHSISCLLFFIFIITNFFITVKEDFSSPVPTHVMTQYIRSLNTIFKNTHTKLPFEC